MYVHEDPRASRVIGETLRALVAWTHAHSDLPLVKAHRLDEASLGAWGMFGWHRGLRAMGARGRRVVRE